MTQQAKLVAAHVPQDPVGAVLLLHGGASRRAGMLVSPTQLSVLRMIPIASRIEHLGGNRLAVYRLLNSTRGWNRNHTPVDDANWAMTEIAGRFGADLPISLVGHSLGGRAALLAAGAAAVRSAVALNPWVYPTDGELDLTGRRILIVHGTQDRIASPANSATVARELARTADLSYLRIIGGKHAMLSHHTRFETLAAQFAVATLTGDESTASLDEVRTGEEWLEL